MGAAIPKTASVYSPTTGLQTDTESLNGSGAVSADIAATYDDFGQRLTYTDAAGTQSTYAYDLAGRVTSSYDGQGTETITYGPGGQALTESDSLAGMFTATYNPDGQLATETYPDGTSATKTIDPAGNSTSLVYSNPHWASSIADSVVANAQGEWTGQKLAGPWISDSRALQHYAGTCQYPAGLVHSILYVWVSYSRPPGRRGPVRRGGEARRSRGEGRAVLRA